MTYGSMVEFVTGYSDWLIRTGCGRDVLAVLNTNVVSAFGVIPLLLSSSHTVLEIVYEAMKATVEQCEIRMLHLFLARYVVVVLE